MKTLKKHLIVFPLLAILFSSQLKAQDENKVLAVITETTEYQTAKKAGENPFPSLRIDVPTSSACLDMSNTMRKQIVSTKSERESYTELNWNKLELNNDGSIWVELPFTFSFCDSLRNTIWINANGNLSFDQSVGRSPPNYCR